MDTVKKLFLPFLLFVFIGITNAQSFTIEGIWKLSEIHDGDETYPINATVNFKENGQIELSGGDAGNWSTNSSKKTLRISSNFLMSLEGDNSIKTLNNEELVLFNSKGDTNRLTRMSLSKNAELNNNATGEWLLEKIEKKAKVDYIGQLVDFNKNGVFYVQGMILGTWSYNESKQLLNIDTKRITGDHAILKNDKTKLIIEKEGEKLYFIKIDRQEIKIKNEASGLLGVWEFEKKTNSDLKTFITFKVPDKFTLLEKGEGMESKSSGIWMFDKKDKSLILIGQVENLRGFNTLISITDKKISLKNKKGIFTLKKVIQDAIDIKRLHFSEGDFYDENGDYKYYEDEAKLPWQDSYQMIADLIQINQLVYKFSTLIESTRSFETKILTADVVANEEEQSLSIDNIFDGYDRYNLPEDYELPTNNFDSYNKLYPLEGHSFRVVGIEEISIPVGTFTCTVIETTASFDERIKLWMINDKPGVLAKVIKDKAGDFGYYKVYKLQDIK